MRARLALLVVLGLIAAGGTATRAQSDDRPLMVNEVASWCPGTSCSNLSVVIRPDGLVHAILNVETNGNISTDYCIGGVSIPEDVSGWAFVRTSYDTRSATAEAEGVEEVPDDVGLVVAIDEARTMAGIEVCELIVRRVQ